MLIIALILMVVTFLLLGIGLYRSSSRFAVEKRIEQVREADGQTAEEELSKPFFQRIALPLGESVAGMFRKYTPGEIADRTHKRLVMAGLYPRVTATQLLGLCWLCAGGCFLLVVFLLATMGSKGGSLNTSDPLNLLYLILAPAAGYIIPQFFLGKRVRERQETILLALPYAIDILSISVEAGMGFDAGVGYTMKKIKGPLAEEFSKTLNEIRLGKPRLDALDDLGNRTGVDEFKAFITAVVHASRLGGSITNTLRIQADSMRVRRRQRAQEKAMKAPVKMVFPLVLFIFPALFVVILGPAGLAIYRQLLQ
ncbi:MAG: type II secretion system F family protein [Verrucomicrobiota bacterium]